MMYSCILERTSGWDATAKQSVIIAHALAAIFSFSDFGCACVGTYEKWVVL